MAGPVRHRQTKEAVTDTFSLQQPRHTSTLPAAVLRTSPLCLVSGLDRTFGELRNGRRRQAADPRPFRGGCHPRRAPPVHANGDCAARDAVLKVMTDF